MAHKVKKPHKSILRTQPPENYKRKNAKFDEVNIMATLHPPDKDYGTTRVEEDKAPFIFNIQADEFLDRDLLTMKIRLAANTQTPSFGDDETISDDEFPETDEEKVQRIVFERRRKAHYNEYKGVQLARELIKEDLIRIKEMPDDVDEPTPTPTDVSINENEVETEEQYTEAESTEGSGAKTDDAAAAQPIFIAPRPQEIEDLLDPSHPCYNKIVKRQQQQKQEQQDQQYKCD